MTSRIPGFYKLSPEARRAALVEVGGVDPALVAAWRDAALPLDAADQMIENVVGVFELPNAVAVNLRINDEDRLVPMVVEEPSVVAAVSNMAQLTRRAGGLTADSDPSVMIGQVHVVRVADVARTVTALEARLEELAAVARAVHPRLEERGGGLRGLRVRALAYDEPGHAREDLVVLEFLLDCRDAMGANMVNTVAERLAPFVEAITGCDVGLRILSNLASHRRSRATCRIPVEILGASLAEGREVAEGIASAWRFAWADPWRACTHNKGVMNGIDAVALATGNDWRAIEAGAHAWAARGGRYGPMTTWRVADDVLTGAIDVPLQLGTVGGPIRIHPKARANLDLLGNRGARDLAAVAAAVGLVQNLGALRALATEGIQAGHMRMHARTVAVLAGAGPSEVPHVVDALCAAREFSETRAREALAALRAR
jgi:hydroxymethylglutaryl-CoA reductase